MKSPNTLQMAGQLTPTWGVVALCIAFAVYRLLQIGRRDPRMPKGPSTVPILGNLHQIPSSGLYAKWVIRTKAILLYLTKPSILQIPRLGAGVRPGVFAKIWTDQYHCPM